jgi:hypothetical protein
MYSNDHFSKSIFFLVEPLIKENMEGGEDVNDTLVKIRTCKILLRIKLTSSV